MAIKTKFKWMVIGCIFMVTYLLVLYTKTKNINFSILYLRDKIRDTNELIKTDGEMELYKSSTSEEVREISSSDKSVLSEDVYLFDELNKNKAIKHSEYSEVPLKDDELDLNEVTPVLGTKNPHTVPEIHLTAKNSWRNFSEQDYKNFSNLARRIFLNEDMKPHDLKKVYKIHVWKFGAVLDRRYLRSYGNITFNPFDECSVQNCKFSYNDSEVGSADAVLFHLHQTAGVNTLPETRGSWQRWVFVSDESPYNTFIVKGPKGMQYLSDYNGVFNWSMHYRIDADVPVPYGRTVEKHSSVNKFETADFAKNKRRFVAILGSNCGGYSERWDYVRELQKHIQIDVYGRCGPFRCEGHFSNPCPVLKEYKFYLAFENSICDQYITEKLWMHGYNMSTVPVVLGAKKSDYSKLLPPKSFIHVEDFKTVEVMAKYLLFLNSSDDHYNEYFKWKFDYEVLNEHGYFQTRTKHYCRLCEALNYNDPAPKVYNDFHSIWSVEKSCYKPYALYNNNNI